jgi:hypothetical protein
MQSVAGSSGAPVDFRRLLSETNTSKSISSTTGTPENSTTTGTAKSSIPETGYSPEAAALHPPPSLSHSLFPSGASEKEEEECLVFFRSRMLPCFPFIVLAPGVTARQMRRDRPFLLQAILTVATFSTQKKLSRADKLKNYLFQSVLLDVESNIDLLLGLLTYLAWSTDAFLGRADLVSRLMMLAISLVYDLRLFKPSPLDVKLMMSITQGSPYENEQLASEETIQEYLEKQRAVLACFILSSKYAYIYHH